MAKKYKKLEIQAQRERKRGEKREIHILNEAAAHQLYRASGERATKDDKWPKNKKIIKKNK